MGLMSAGTAQMTWPHVFSSSTGLAWASNDVGGRIPRSSQSDEFHCSVPLLVSAHLTLVSIAKSSLVANSGVNVGESVRGEQQFLAISTVTLGPGWFW